MNRDSWHRLCWTSLCAGLLLIGYAALVCYPVSFRVLGLRGAPPIFADSVAVLAAGEAAVAGDNPYAANPRDPYMRPHVYGPAWLVSGHVGLTRADAWWVGTGLALAFVFAATIFFRPRSARDAAWTVALLLSPPLVLAVERANNDLVIFLLLAFAAWALGRSRRSGSVAATAAIVLAAILKFYPLAALAALPAQPRRWRTVVLAALVGAGAFAAVWILQRDEIARALALAPEPMTIFAFGLRLAKITWDVLPSERAWLLLGSVPTLLAGVCWLRGRARELSALLPERGTITAAAVAGGASWLLCYAWTTNFPYRALLLALVAPALLAVNSRGAREMLALLCAAFWLHAPMDWCATLFDAHPTRTVALHALAVVTAVQQAAIFLLSVAVACLLGGWAWRRALAEWGIRRVSAESAPTAPAPVLPPRAGR